MCKNDSICVHVCVCVCVCESMSDEWRHRLARMEQQLATLQLQVSGLLPRADVGMFRDPVSDDVDAARLVGDIGGSDELVRWDAADMYAIGTNGRLGTMTEQDIRVYPIRTVGRVDVTRWVFVGGPCAVQGDDGHELVPEFGRACIYPMLMAHSLSYFNGQLPSVCTVSVIQATLRALIDASCVVICFYPCPWPSWFELALYAYSIGCGNRNVYTVVQSELTEQAFDARECDVCNVYGAPSRVLTLRQRMLEVYGILRTLQTTYDTLVADGRVCNEYDGGKSVIRSIGAVVRTRKHRLVDTQEAPIPVSARMQLGRDVFGTTQSDVALYIRLVYLLALYGGMRQEHADVYNGLRGEAAACVCGFIVSVQQWDTHTPGARVHMRRVQPVVMLIYAMLRSSGVAMPVFAAVPSD